MSQMITFSLCRLDYVDCDEFVRACSLGDFLNMLAIYSMYDGNDQGQGVMVNHKLVGETIDQLVPLPLSLSLEPPKLDMVKFLLEEGADTSEQVCC